MTEKFDYGKDNLASKYTYPSGKTATYSYDSILRRNRTVINTTTPIDHQYVYWMSDRGNNSRTKKIGWEHIGEYIYGYTYDSNGNITEISRRHKTAETAYTKQQQFAYDELNQLVRADDLVKNCTEVYTYDNGGNILKVTTYPLTWGSLDGITATKTVNYGYDDTNWKDKLTSYDGQSITYDEIGNPLSYRGYTLTWQNGRQLATLNGNGTITSYTYDVGGLRTSKTVNGVKHEFYYVGGTLRYEKFGSTELWFFYDPDGNPSGVRYKNGSAITDYYFVCDWRGDVIRIYDGAGAVVANYNYDAWGNVISVTDANGTAITDSTHIANVNPLRYRGYYYDSETGMYYLQSRYYDPITRRFINADSLFVTGKSLQGHNMFAYCLNNPIMYSDYSGHDVTDAGMQLAALLASCFLLGYLADYATENGCDLSNINDFFFRMNSRNDDNIFQLLGDLKLGVAALSGDIMIVRLYGEKGIYNDIASLAKKSFPQVKWLSLITGIVINMIPEYCNPFNSTADVVLALGKQIVIQFGSAGIAASSWYIAGVFSVINPVVGFLAGTAWYFGMQGLWETVSNEL